MSKIMQNVINDFLKRDHYLELGRGTIERDHYWWLHPQLEEQSLTRTEPLPYPGDGLQAAVEDEKKYPTLELKGPYADFKVAIQA